MKYSKETRELIMELEELKRQIEESIEIDNSLYNRFKDAKRFLIKDFEFVGFTEQVNNDINLDNNEDDIFLTLENNDIYCTLWGDGIITLTDLRFDNDVIICTIDICTYLAGYDMVSRFTKYLMGL